MSLSEEIRQYAKQRSEQFKVTTPMVAITQQELEYLIKTTYEDGWRAGRIYQKT